MLSKQSFQFKKIKIELQQLQSLPVALNMLFVSKTMKFYTPLEQEHNPIPCHYSFRKIELSSQVVSIPD
jgi:hypothetical protein